MKLLGMLALFSLFTGDTEVPTQAPTKHVEITCSSYRPLSDLDIRITDLRDIDKFALRSEITEEFGKYRNFLTRVHNLTVNSSALEDLCFCPSEIKGNFEVFDNASLSEINQPVLNIIRGNCKLLNLSNLRRIGRNGSSEILEIFGNAIIGGCEKLESISLFVHGKLIVRNCSMLRSITGAVDGSVVITGVHESVTIESSIRDKIYLPIT